MGVYGAKKAVEFAKAFMKARKEASEESAGELSAVATNDEGGEDQGGDEKETEVINMEYYMFAFARPGAITYKASSFVWLM